MRAESELMGTSCKPTTVGHNQKYLIMSKSGSDGSLFDSGYLYVSLSAPIEERALRLKWAYGTCRASYVLREVYKLSYGAIAKIFGMSRGTVAE
jgi:hypothetical protein